MRAVLSDLKIDPDRPIQQQLYSQLSGYIIQQRIASGSRMPSSRQLASDLGISRNSVVAVYEQLRSEGFLEARTGSGFYVHHDLMSFCGPGFKPEPRETKHDMARKSSASRIPERRPLPRDHNLPFTPGLPDLAAFPLKAWNRILHQQESRISLTGYDSEAGFYPLRQALAGYLRSSRGVRCEAEQIILTSGAQQALALIADVKLQPGDTILTEDPGYRGARAALGRGQHPLVPVPLRNQVLDIAALPRLASARLLYCTPTHQYPMGGILDISERLALLNWASESGTWIIEDDYDSEFHFYQKPVAAIQGMFDATPVLYVGSFSKTLMPALRLGYLVVPDSLVDAFAARKRITTGESPLLMQAVVAEFIDSGRFVSHLRRMRLRYQVKWQTFHALVSRRLSKWVTVVAESAGMHLVLTGHFNDVALSEWLYAQGFGSTPLSAHCLGNQQQSGLILGFASATEEQMQVCIERLQDWFAKNQENPA
jgi:GntR family transcriptional regulator/MocR family aminotransferase